MVTLAAAIAIGVAWFARLGPRSASTEAPPRAVSTPASAAHPLSDEQLERSIAQMNERVKANPKDAPSWAMLAHSYDMLGRYVDASKSYAKLIELLPNDPQVLVDAADSLALARGRRLEGEPMKLIERALALDPKNLKALSLAGTEAFDRKDAAQALTYWKRARELVKDGPIAEEIDASIAAANTLKAGGGAAASAPVANVASMAASGASSNAASNVASIANAYVSGRITLAAGLKAQMAPGDTVFVFARPAEGSRMPVALMRRVASELPFEFELDDSMAMTPQARLSGQTQVVIGARISKRGDATPKAGDLQGLSPPVPVGTTGLKLEINEVVK